MTTQPTELFVRFAALWLFTTSTAFAGELLLENARSSDGSGTATAILRPAPAEGAEILVEDSDGLETVRGTLKPLASDLWVLIDSASLCQSQKADAYLNRLVQSLKRHANPDTLLTLVTYTSEGLDVIARRRPIATVSDPKIECETRPLSASYDRPLSGLLQELKPQALPTVAWIYTSGNIELSKDTAKAIAVRNIELHLVLYNEFIQKEILPAWQTTQGLLRGQRASFGVMPKADAGIWFPSMAYRLEFAVPREWRGSSTALQFSAKAPGATAPFARREMSIDVPLSGLARIWTLYGRLILTMLALLMLGYGSYRLVLYYRPRRCSQCRRRVAFPVGVCLFCRDSAFLVGNGRRRADGFGDTGKAPGSPTVVALSERETELGSHRNSLVRLPVRGRKRAYVRLVREPRAVGPVAYRIVRAPLTSGIDLRVNGRRLDGERYLSPGDEVLIDTTLLTFFVGGSHA